MMKRAALSFIDLPGVHYGRQVPAGQAAGRRKILHAVGSKQTSKQQFCGGSVTQQTDQTPSGQLHGITGGGARIGYPPPAAPTTRSIDTTGVATARHCPGIRLMGATAPIGVVMSVSRTGQFVRLHTWVVAHDHGT